MEKKKEFERCLRCGRKLKTEEARKLGYGKICYTKVQICRAKVLFSLHNTK